MTSEYYSVNDHVIKKWKALCSAENWQFQLDIGLNQSILKIEQGKRLYKWETILNWERVSHYMHDRWKIYKSQMEIESVKWP